MGHIVDSAGCGFQMACYKMGTDDPGKDPLWQVAWVIFFYTRYMDTESGKECKLMALPNKFLLFSRLVELYLFIFLPSYTLCFLSFIFY